MGNATVPFICSSHSDLLRFNQGELLSISIDIGLLVAVEHYKRQGILSSKLSHELLVLAFSNLWFLKVGKGKQPYNARAQRFYNKAIQLQHQPDRFQQFCAVNTANTACALTFVSAIASFPAELQSEAATSNPPATPATTIIPQEQFHFDPSRSLLPRICELAFDFSSPVHGSLAHVSMPERTAPTSAASLIDTSAEDVFGVEVLEPLPLLLFQSPPAACPDVDIEDASLQADTAVFFPTTEPHCDTTPATQPISKKHPRSNLCSDRHQPRARFYCSFASTRRLLFES